MYGLFLYNWEYPIVNCSNFHIIEKKWLHKILKLNEFWKFLKDLQTKYLFSIKFSYFIANKWLMNFIIMKHVKNYSVLIHKQKTDIYQV